MAMAIYSKPKYPCSCTIKYNRMRLKQRQTVGNRSGRHKYEVKI
uniref:Uncharacterized protein n=1 Tax=Rhizophora mucronata TaxID=61149 RepID=A0A2P2ISX0_RHIMU